MVFSQTKWTYIKSIILVVKIKWRKKICNRTYKRKMSPMLFIHKKSSNLGIHLYFIEVCVYICVCVCVCYMYGYMCISISIYLNRHMNMHIFVCGSWNVKSNIFQLNKWIFMCLTGFIINQDDVSLDTRVSVWKKKL